MKALSWASGSLLAWGVLGLLLCFLGCSPPQPLPKAVPASEVLPSGGSAPAPPPATTPASDAGAPPSTVTAVPTPPPARRESREPVPTEIAELARQLAAGQTSDKAKALALYDWVAQNIRYDITAYQSGDLPNPSPQLVLASRSAVCEGYARLFVAMAQAVGLEAEMVVGYSKGFSPEEAEAEPDHAWNAVKLDGEWVLLDPTWGSGHIDASKRFVAEFSRDWFATPPREFAATHLPTDPRWQLLSNPLSKEQFLAQPSLSRNYFAYELQLRSHPDGRLESDGLLQLEITAGKECRMMAALYQDSGKLSGTPTLVERRGRDFTITVDPPHPGRYQLVVLVGPPDDNRTTSAVVYELQAGPSSRGDDFPKTLRTFTDQQVQLIAPRGELRRGMPTELVLEAPGASELMAVLNEKQIPFVRQGDRFVLGLTPEGDKVGVFANYDGGQTYQGLLEFGVTP